MVCLYQNEQYKSIKIDVLRWAGKRCDERFAHDILEVDPPDVPAAEAALPHRVEQEDLEVGSPGWAAVIAGSIYDRTKIY